MTGGQENKTMDEQTSKKVDAEIANLIAETGKMNVQTARLNSENRYYPIIVTATATLALVAVVKLFL